MKILKVKIGSLSVTEFFEFLKQIQKIIDRYDATALNIKNDYDALVASFTDLQAALDKEKSNELTKKLNELDHKRDRLINAFVKWLNVMQDYPDATVAASATSFLHIVNGYSKNIARETFLSETTIINSVVDAFTNNAANATALAAMNGSLWITALNTVNTDFANQYSQRVANDTTNNEVGSFSVVRQVSTALYHAVILILNSRYTTAKADNKDVTTYEACIGELNTLIANANILAVTSVTHRAAKTDTPPQQ